LTKRLGLQFRNDASGGNLFLVHKLRDTM
jgi:hypothetical protein